jgi:hypothetical protein
VFHSGTIRTKQKNTQIQKEMNTATLILGTFACIGAAKDLEFLGDSSSHLKWSKPKLALIPKVKDSSSSSNSLFFPAFDDSSSSSSSSTAFRPIHWKYITGLSHPLIYKTFFKPGKATGLKVFIPGQDYKIDYYEQGDLSKKQTEVAGDKYDVNLFREGDTYKNTEVHHGDDVNVNAYRAGDKYYDQKVFVEGSKNIQTGRGEDMFYKHPTVVIPNTHQKDKGLDLDIVSMKMPSKPTILSDSSSSSSSTTFPNDSSSSKKQDFDDNSSASLLLRGSFH